MARSRPVHSHPAAERARTVSLSDDVEAGIAQLVELTAEASIPN